MLLSNIYRSPTPTVNSTQAEHAENFINHLDIHLSNLSNFNSDTYVFLDSNINLLKLNYSQTPALYLEKFLLTYFSRKLAKPREYKVTPTP